MLRPSLKAKNRAGIKALGAVAAYSKHHKASGWVSFEQSGLGQILAKLSLAWQPLAGSSLAGAFETSCL